MMKLFHKTRQRLFQENRLAKYLFYALGEIILVMIGILLALQVNNWNDNRIKAGKELNYLRDIRSNLEDDLKEIDRVVGLNNQKSILSDSMYYTLNRYSDPKVYAYLFIMMTTTQSQSQILLQMREETEDLIQLINQQLPL